MGLLAFQLLAPLPIHATKNNNTRHPYRIFIEVFVSQAPWHLLT